MAAVLALGTVGCAKDKDDKDGLEYKTAELTATTPIEIVHQNDPQAAYPVGVRILLSDGKLVVEGVATNPRSDLTGLFPGSTVCRNNAVIADAGKAKSLSSIKKLPAETAFAESASVLENEGYVIEVHSAANVSAYQRPEIYDPGKMYIRVCVGEQTEAGKYSVKYQYPFEVE